MMIDIQENAYVRIKTVDATFTRTLSFRKIATIMKAPVKSIEICGVLNRRLTFPRKPGKSPSLLKARGYLDADIRPALAVETNARIAAMLNRILPHVPIKTAAASEIGVRE